MRNPIKPFVVEVKRAGRAVARPTKDMWAATDDPPREHRQVRQDADRAFAAAASVATNSIKSAEPRGRVLVAQGYRSPLELRMEQEELDRAARRRPLPTKSANLTERQVADAIEVSEAPEVVTWTGTRDDVVEFSASLGSTQTSIGTKRNAHELPRHQQWMKRLRHLR